MHPPYVLVKKYLMIWKYNARGDRGSESQEKDELLARQAQPQRRLLALLDILASGQIIRVQFIFITAG